MQYLILVLFLTGCASTSMSKLKHYPSKASNCQIEVLTQKPDKKFEEIALLNARSGQSIFESKTVHSLLPKLKKSACQAGGDAIIITNSKEGGYNFGGPADRANASATVIKYKK